MVSAALERGLNRAHYTAHPIFKVWVPDAVPGVPANILNPRTAWKDPVAYDHQQVQKLAGQFVENFTQFATAQPDIIAAGPDVTMMAEGLTSAQSSLGKFSSSVEMADYIKLHY